MCNQLYVTNIYYRIWTYTVHEASTKYRHRKELTMAEPYLKYRKRFTSSLKNQLAADFDELSKITRIPKSRLLDEAIEDLLTKHNYKETSHQNPLEN